MKAYFINKAHKLEQKSQKLAKQLNPAFLADNCVKENLLKNLRLLEDIPKGLDLLIEMCKSKYCADNKRLVKRQRNSSTKWNVSAISQAVKNWRRRPTKINYDKIPLEEKKEIFDYFFRYDVYGSLRKDSTVHLSRGVNDPNYFFPPAFVKVGLNIAGENDWFGYSDSLGHRDTRFKIAQLETVRRNQKNFTAENTAVVQGGTEGLNAVLSFLSKQNSCKKKCVVLTPTYAPIIDVIGYYFEPKLHIFNPDYTFSLEKIIEDIDAKTGVVLFSVPHNPGGFADMKKFLPALQNKCAQYGAYFIMDEIMFDNQLSPHLDPLKYKNLIVLSSYSKMYNIPGLKLGHILADKSFIDKFYRHASTTYGSPPSFLYYTASLTAFYEKAFAENKKAALPAELKDKASDKSILLQEFKIWRETIELHSEFQKYAILSLIKHFKLERFLEIFGLQDASPNVIIRVNNSKQSAYELFLRILTECDVSVIPIECFVPPSDWPADLRFTPAVEPKVLVKSLKAVFECIRSVNNM